MLLDFLLLNAQLTIFDIQLLLQFRWEVVQVEELVQVYLTRVDPELVEELLLRGDITHERYHILEEFVILKLMNVVNLLDRSIDVLVYGVDLRPTFDVLLRLFGVHRLEFFEQVSLKVLDQATNASLSLLFELTTVEPYKPEVVVVVHLHLNFPVCRLKLIVLLHVGLICDLLLFNELKQTRVLGF